jgi:hypothetical protein
MAVNQVLTLVTLHDATQMWIDFVYFTSLNGAKARITTVAAVHSFKWYFAKTWPIFKKHIRKLHMTVNGAALTVLTLVTLHDATQIRIDSVCFTSAKVAKPIITIVAAVDSFKCCFEENLNNLKNNYGLCTLAKFISKLHMTVHRA